MLVAELIDKKCEKVVYKIVHFVIKSKVEKKQYEVIINKSILK